MVWFIKRDAWPPISYIVTILIDKENLFTNAGKLEFSLKKIQVKKRIILENHVNQFYEF